MKSTSSLLDRISGFLYRRVWSDTSFSNSKRKALFSAALKIISIVFLKIIKDTVMFRARGLALTVVLAMVPMLALGTAVLKGVGISEETRVLAHRYLDQIVVSGAPLVETRDAVERNGPDGGVSSGPNAPKKALLKQDLVIHLQQVVDKIFGYIDRTDFATLGFAGTVVILILVASFFYHLESSMNTIWEVKKGRSLWKRGVNYLAVLILLPIAMNFGFAAMAVLQSSTLVAKLETTLPAPWMLSFLLKLFPGLVVTGTFAALYKFLPNTHVSTLHAVSGGVLAGISWLLVLLLYLNLQLGVARYNAIYGSFATIPLILLWIYMGWVIFLIGAELVFAFQIWREYDPGELLTPADDRLGLSIEILMALKREQDSGHPLNVKRLAETLGYSLDCINAALLDLERTGFIEMPEKDGALVVISNRTVPPSIPGRAECSGT